MHMDDVETSHCSGRCAVGLLISAMHGSKSSNSIVFVFFVATVLKTCNLHRHLPTSC
jgi:hypothetical protein